MMRIRAKAVGPNCLLKRNKDFLTKLQIIAAGSIISYTRIQVLMTFRAADFDDCLDIIKLQV